MWLPENFLLILAAALGSFVASAQIFLTQRSSQKPLRTFLLEHSLFVIVSVLIALFIFVATNPRNAFLVGLAVPLVFLAITRPNFESRRIAKLQQTVQRAEAAVEKDPEKARPAWELSRAQFELYINLNLAQVGQIFWITIAVMFAGFCLVVYGVYRAFDAQIQIAVVTAGSGIITQMIGASFLLIYRSTMRQATDYVGTLERINAVGMAVAILEEIPDENIDLKNKARVDLMKQITSSPRPRSPREN
jgi:hypothetical protein